MRSRHRRLQIALLVIATACRESAWTPMGSADLVLSEIKLTGGAAVAKRLDDDENFARSVLEGVASGDSSWMQVAARLTPRSAAAEASMEMALASALVNSPARVLALLLQKKYPLGKVCGIPFLEADSTRVSAYHDSAASALATVRDSTLATARDTCLTRLNSARDWKMSRVDPAYIIKNKPKAR